MKRVLLTFTVLMIALTASAVRAKDGHRSRRVDTSSSMTRGVESAVKVPRLTGNFKALIILAAFQNKDFSSDDPNSVWNDIANKPGYDEHGAVGCIADYFSAQSRGRFNLTFDVVGPVKLPRNYAFYGQNSNGIEGNDRNAAQMISDACNAVDSLVDFSQYDWDGNGEVEMVFVLYAGMGENDRGDADTVWPHKASMFWRPMNLDGVRIDTYACCNEVAGDKVSLSGLGTFCHEFSHCLGLPDLYENSGAPVLDEWDLMDGGCYANSGWTPVGYSAYEKYLCGWLEPEELTEQTVINGLPALDIEDKAYLIRSDTNSKEFYILENRQWTGWDTYLPGHGLLVTQVVGHRDQWNAYPNTSSTHPIDIVHADNRDYDTWKDILKASGLGPYNDEGRSRLLASSAFPFEENDSLTAYSVPVNRIGKPIFNIREEEGLVSFQFLTSPVMAISAIAADVTPVAVFDCYGRRYMSVSDLPPYSYFYIVRYSDGSVKKVIR